MNIVVVPPNFVDKAWQEGAHTLSEACDTSGGEVTGDQVKMLCARGERTLLRMDGEDGIVGWSVIRIDQLPNMRVLHVCELVAHNAHFELFIDELKGMAAGLGCSRVRCSAKPAQARLYRMKLGFQPVYETLEVTL